jgi:bifunctional non-homologous end joining protein LigD
MLCLAVSDLPEGLQWGYELKLDGYRAIGIKTRGRVLLLSRNGKDFTRPFQPLACALDAVPDETVVDGEVGALDETGRPSFNLLQNYSSNEYTLVFYTFDLPIFAGKSLMREPLKVRRELLRSKVMPLLGDKAEFTSIGPNGPEFHRRGFSGGTPGGKGNNFPQCGEVAAVRFADPVVPPHDSPRSGLTEPTERSIGSSWREATATLVRSSLSLCCWQAQHHFSS